MDVPEITGHSLQLKKLSLMRENEKIPHALLFSGINGIGKKTVAFRFFLELFCTLENPPCLSCPTCRQVLSGTFPDLILIEPNDKGKIPIGNQDNSEPGSIRWLISRISRKSISARYGVIIDGVDKLTPAGQNALLKTIEEPQKGTVIILITSNRSRILPTILSRCSHISFNPLLDSDVEAILKRNRVEYQGSHVIDLAGGSVEIATMLTSNEILDGVTAVCREIDDFILENRPMELNISTIQKKTGAENLIHILLNIYRHRLISLIQGEQVAAPGGDQAPVHAEKLSIIIKILLALKKGLPNNLNIKYFLKGMVYSIDSMHDIGIPEI